jgi:hypothetical protein
MKFVLPLLLASLPLAAQTTNPPPAPDEAAPATNSAPMTSDSSEPAVINAPAPQATAAPEAPAALTNPADVPLPDPFSDPVIKQVVARHEKAVNGDKKETKALTADLERWTQDEPQNYLLLAYLGSAYTLDSRDAWPGPGKLTYLRKGGAALDAAVQGDPQNPAVRFVRAINFYELPALFGKHRAAHDDFEYLLAQLKGTLPMPYTLNADTRQAIYYYAGLSEVQFSQQSLAKDAWQSGIALAPQSKLGQKMQAELNKLR